MRYSEHRFYSPFLDASACRLSVWDDRGGEFFTILPVARNWRETRTRALNAIADAIEEGAQPGEVAIG